MTETCLMTNSRLAAKPHCAPPSLVCARESVAEAAKPMPSAALPPTKSRRLIVLIRSPPLGRLCERSVPPMLRRFGLGNKPQVQLTRDRLIVRSCAAQCAGGKKIGSEDVVMLRVFSLLV